MLSSWEEKFTSQGQQHSSKLEHLRQTNEETMKKYQEDTKKNLIAALPILRSNLVLHAQVAVGPLDLSQVNFNYFKKVNVEFLNLMLTNLKVKTGRSSKKNGGN
ncbi:hypothetical protein PVK06_005382 [Gossypium arboreum]|uniref:Uncharacterized protein n=1 Tax=Gossypium arboreum TaxID=29729 RepID=A0ABR0QVI8_GOSAR|nr:hypothetical protein PVK06_005382 [Gossypium arboreum]